MNDYNLVRTDISSHSVYRKDDGSASEYMLTLSVSLIQRVTCLVLTNYLITYLFFLTSVYIPHTWMLALIPTTISPAARVDCV